MKVMLIRAAKVGLWMALGAGLYAAFTNWSLHEPDLRKTGSKIVAQAKAKAQASSLLSPPKKPAASPKKPAGSPQKPRLVPAKPSTPRAKPAFEPKIDGGRTQLAKTGLAGFSFPRIALAHNVTQREPVEPGQRFSPGSKVFLFLEAKNTSSFAQGLQVHWHLGDKEPVVVDLEVPAMRPRYRTWANSGPLIEPGQYEVSLHFTGGHELLRVPFSVQGQATRQTR